MITRPFFVVEGLNNIRPYGNPPGLVLTLFRLGFLRVAQLGGGGGGRKVPVAYNYKTINDNEMKLGGVVKKH